MFGHIDSSHTVASLCRRTFCFTAWYFLPVGKRARNQSGLRPAGTALALVPAFCPFLIARVPLGLTNLPPEITALSLLLMITLPPVFNAAGMITAWPAHAWWPVSVRNGPQLAGHHVSIASLNRRRFDHGTLSSLWPT